MEELYCSHVDNENEYVMATDHFQPNTRSEQENHGDPCLIPLLDREKPGLGRCSDGPKSHSETLAELAPEPGVLFCRWFSFITPGVPTVFCEALGP